MSSLLERLNPEQRAAVTHRDGPLLILAGAGSGKTRVITHRIAWLVREADVPPEKILAVTFTNKAAGEMRDRVAALLGPQAERVWVSTFHAAGVRILRRDGGRIGLPPNLVIYDDADQRSLMKRVLDRLDLDETAYTPRTFLSRIDHAKSMGLGPDDLEAAGPYDLVGRRLPQVYRAYVKALRAAGALDFGDLLLETVRLFRTCPDVLARYQRMLPFVMVDEFQDTSPVQYELLRLLAGERRNLAVVGDDDQSIYRWRGADVRNILTFEKDYPEAKVVRLERNYRSTQTILDAAYEVISKSPRRKEKRLWTDEDGGAAIEVRESADELEEARTVARIVEDLEQEVPRREIAIFYRVNAQSRAIEEALRASRIPYHVVRGRAFYDRAEVKDITAYLRLAVMPDSDADLLRVINTPRRQIGGTTVKRVQAEADARGVSLWQVLVDDADIPEVTASVRRKLDAFVAILKDLHEKVGSDRPPHEIVEAAMTGSGYVAALEQAGTEEARDRLANLNELLAAAALRADEGHDLQSFLDEMALTGDADDREEGERVSLMTLHAAKGLEFDAVVLTGLEERTFPHNRAFSDDGLDADPEEIAEERRLCYVGFTRARKRLFLTWARSRFRMGVRRALERSRFVADVPEALLHGDVAPAVRAFSGGPSFRRPRSDWMPSRGGPAWGEPDLGSDDGFVEQAEPSGPDLGEEDGIFIDYGADQRPATEVGGPAPGRRVEHRTFGIGTIQAVEGRGPNARLDVAFPGVGVKRIVARYVKLA